MRSDAFYHRWHDDGFWADGDAEIECRRTKLVVTRFPHFCPACNGFTGKEHPAGTRMMRDSAKVEGRFGTCYTCLPCIEKWAAVCDPNGVEFAG